MAKRAAGPPPGPSPGDEQAQLLHRELLRLLTRRCGDAGRRIFDSGGSDARPLRAGRLSRRRSLDDLARRIADNVWRDYL